MRTTQQPQTEATLFPLLTPEQIAEIAPYGEEIRLGPNEILFREGDPEDAFFVVREGKIKITRIVEGGEIVLAIHEPGEFTGALSLLTGGKSIASASAIGPAWLQRISADQFRRLLVECPEIASVILSSMAARRPSADTMLQEREKLAALGKMAAGLAHELNNPASAAQRASADLRHTLAELQKQTALLVCLIPTASWQKLDTLFAEAAERRSQAIPRSPVEISDQEEVIGTWLEDQSVPDAWKLAATLAEAGLEPRHLQEVGQAVGGEALGTALAWASARLEADSLLNSVEQSTGRISDLVGAIKSYTYMDQAPHQKIDIVRGVENTLTILAHKWRSKGIEIVRDYAPALPSLEGFGSELNQVWTNLLDNAIDATPSRGGEIRIEARAEDSEHLLVAITDNGAGIPPGVLGRIFEPFFTTKAPGEGTGMGLDITYLIVTQRHRGDIRVARTAPGETRFEVRLPFGGTASANLIP
ncbi:MAG: cyclic nucleotide-binding domain-containing protein [Cytophagales bacterium]|nr:cyclic nucleotide-binding domain-containing protein [Armatimonadota bacterium]